MAIKLTIYQALRNKLGREPTNAELKADVQRIKTEALIEAASKGKLAYQKRRRNTGKIISSNDTDWIPVHAIRRCANGDIQILTEKGTLSNPGKKKNWKFIYNNFNWFGINFYI